MKLLLFDIDGTILLTHGLGRAAVQYALRETFGRDFHFDAVSFSGKTDPQIFREVMEHHGVAEEEIDAVLPEVMRRYEVRMHETLAPEAITVLPGVVPLLERLGKDPQVMLGLVTGNIEPIAYRKLEHVGLAEHFPFGAFGSDSAVRAELPAIAVARAERHVGHRFAGKDVLIIGDTEHDVTCGRGIGAFAVAVCTGRYTREDLHAHGPDLLLDSLEDADSFFREALLRAA